MAGKKKSKTKSVSVQGSSKFRTRWRHVAIIDERVRGGSAPNCNELSRELEVCSRTVLRDIEFMRYDLGAPIEYDPARNGYVYTEPSWSLPNIRLTEGELLAMAVGEKVVRAFGDSPWAKRLSEAFGKITAGLSERIDVGPEGLASRFDFAFGGIAIVDESVLATLETAIRENHHVQMTYNRLDIGDEKKYKVEPYLLLRRRGAWYLVGRDCKSGHKPMFNLSRIRKLKLLKSQFDYALSGFDRKEYLGDLAWAYHGQEEYRVAINFSGKAASLVEERLWHPSQKLRRLKDGRLRFEVTVHHLWDILPWILSWASEAKVIKPQQLKTLVKSEIRAMAAGLKK